MNELYTLFIYVGQSVMQISLKDFFQGSLVLALFFSKCFLCLLLFLLLSNSLRNSTPVMTRDEGFGLTFWDGMV